MSPSRFTSALRRLLGLTVSPPVRTSVKRNANRFRPLLERCEERDVPAASGTAFYDLNGNPPR